MSFPEQNVLECQQFFLMVQEPDSSIKLIQIATRPFDIQNALQQIKLVRVKNNPLNECIFGLEIGLSI